MATREDFTPDEWATIFQSPTMAGMVVMTAGRSGPIRLRGGRWAAAPEGRLEGGTGVQDQQALQVKLGRRVLPGQPQLLDVAPVGVAQGGQVLAVAVDARELTFEDMNRGLVVSADQQVASLLQGGLNRQAVRDNAVPLVACCRPGAGERR